MAREGLLLWYFCARAGHVTGLRCEFSSVTSTVSCWSGFSWMKVSAKDARISWSGCCGIRSRRRGIVSGSGRWHCVTWMSATAVSEKLCEYILSLLTLFTIESDRISFSFSFSVPKMLIFDGFGHFRFRPKMILLFRFRFRFRRERRTKTPKLNIQAAISSKRSLDCLQTVVNGPMYNG